MHSVNHMEVGNSNAERKSLNSKKFHEVIEEYRPVQIKDMDGTIHRKHPSERGRFDGGLSHHKRQPRLHAESWVNG
jgi:hypothetical protein